MKVLGISGPGQLPREPCSEPGVGAGAGGAGARGGPVGRRKLGVFVGAVRSQLVVEAFVVTVVTDPVD